MCQMMRIAPLLLILAPLPLGAAPPAPTDEGIRAIPQPVLLDWGGQFRLNAPPNNVSEASLKRAADAEEARLRHPIATTPPPVAAAKLGPEDPARTRVSSRTIETDDKRLTVAAPVKAGPVSLGASYGKYRAVPTSTREVSADDARVSLGVAF